MIAIVLILGDRQNIFSWLFASTKTKEMIMFICCFVSVFPTLWSCHSLHQPPQHYPEMCFPVGSNSMRGEMSTATTTLVTAIHCQVLNIHWGKFLSTCFWRLHSKYQEITFQQDLTCFDVKLIYSLDQTDCNTPTLVTLNLPREDQTAALISLVNKW